MSDQELTLVKFGAMLDGAAGPEVEQEMVHRMILAALAKLGGAAANEDDLVFKGKKFILPAHFNGDIQAAIKYLNDLDVQRNTVHRFSHTFNYRPDDVAWALGEAMHAIFGSTGVGKETVGFFGDVTPPTFRTIDVGFGEQAQVIQGETRFEPLKATVEVGYANHPELGRVGHITIDAPRKFRGQVEGLFKAIADVLETRSIYRGKAINGQASPGFLNTKLVDPRRVIYTREVMSQLEANLWTPIRHTSVLRDMGTPVKRSVLLEGPYGTGKSLAAAITAQICTENDWTFIQVGPMDDLELAMKTARLYEPAVVFYEDVDGVNENGDPLHVSRLLDMFDGITAKGSDVIVVLTTNHPEKIQKGMLRPGRMDAVVHIGAMDPDGYQRLIECNVPEELLADIDFGKVAQAMEGMLPAFAMEAINRAVRYGVARCGGKPDFLTTDDFVDAALGLRPQLAMMEEAGEGERTPTLDRALRELFRNSGEGMELVYSGKPSVAMEVQKPVKALNGSE